MKICRNLFHLIKLMGSASTERIEEPLVFQSRDRIRDRALDTSECLLRASQNSDK